MRLSKIVTKTGDKGTTTLGTGEEVSKDNPRIMVLGDMDELNSMIGWVRVEMKGHTQDGILETIQNDLFNLGGQVSIPGGGNLLFDKNTLRKLEEEIEKLNETLLPLKEFVLPGGAEVASRLYMARSQCRRTERGMVTLLRNDPSIADLIPYINRLSDYLFVLSRVMNRDHEAPEKMWTGIV